MRSGTLVWWSRGRVRGGCTGVGYGTGWVGGGLYRVPTQPAARGALYSEAGPGSPARAGVGGTGRTYWGTAAGTAPGTTSCGGPVGPLRGPPCPRTLRNAASWPITARFDLYLLKVSQNRVVSPKKCQKASHSPYFQNGVQKSPLGILRFP